MFIMSLIDLEIKLNELYYVKNINHSNGWGFSQRGLNHFEPNPKYEKGNGEKKWIDRGTNWIRKTTNTGE